MDSSKNVRVETDTFGPIEVDAHRYWGAQTQRSLQNFKIGGERMPPPLVRALGIVKLAAARVNARLGELDGKLAETIGRAAQEVIDGKLTDEFPLVVWQTGSGTQTNMNANEVIASRANELLGGERGGKAPVHPNDHVNRGQSSNDTFPTAMHIAAAEQAVRELLPALEHLHAALVKKGQEFSRHHQDRPHPSAGRDAADAGPGVLGLRDPDRLRHRAREGGAAAGLSTWPRAARRSAPGSTPRRASPRRSPPRWQRSPACRSSPRPTSSRPWPRTTRWSSCTARSTCWPTSLMKIANDIRLLGSGPRCGFGELKLPENEPGSSIMPGKVNPTQSEALTMVCYQVMGNNVSVTLGRQQRPPRAQRLQAGDHLQRAAVDPAAGRLRAAASPTTASSASRPIASGSPSCCNESLMLVTALNPKIGYDNAAKVAKKAHKEGTTLKQAALALGLLTAEEFDQWVRPEHMLGPSD